MKKRMRFFKILLVGTAPFILFSCIVAKTYQNPEMSLGGYRLDKTEISNDKSMATIPWKTFIQDTILQNYITKSFQNNFDIRQAIQQISIADAYIKQAKTGYLPTLNGQVTATHTEMSKNTNVGAIIGSSSEFGWIGNLSWEADIWGKIRSQQRVADADYLTTVAAHQLIQTSLVAKLSTLYFQLLAIDKQIEITNNTIATREKSWQTMLILNLA